MLMKLKVSLLAVFALGLGASLALAQTGRAHDGGDKGSSCHKISLRGTVAPQTLAMTVTGSHPNGVVANGAMTITVGATGEIVRARVEACSTGTGTTFTVREVDLRVLTPKTTTSTGKHHDEDDQGENGHTSTGTTVKTTTTTHA
jgi:hypothetical protein